ncbi:anhydro-N-acetylmuramic acid kinase [candidate division KSB1 bacterium]|nr:anhydro-N-acetylmuramic acid kinase [candidate division KSB1 bacterium]
MSKLNPLIELYNKNEKKVVGLMSGTSLDGIDAALIKITNSGSDTEIELINFITIPYPNELRDQLLEISLPGGGTVEEICQMNFLIAEYYVDAIVNLCDLSEIEISELDLIGSHGQTVHHLPEAEKLFEKNIRSTLQLGEPSVIAAKTGIVTVGNFRSADLAVGGQGAPLVPYFDFLLFASKKRNRVLLNIGGIANVTILPKNISSDRVLAFDTGPGNMVINALMKKLYNREYDKDGEVASQGKISQELLEELKQFFYFSKAAPKSTGREDFGDKFVEGIFSKSEKLNLSQEDIITTVTELTAQSIADALQLTNLSLDKVDELIVSGGGAFNKVLMKSVTGKFRYSDVVLSDKYGIPVDAKEAICFAVLANETIHGNPTNLPSVTGAKWGTVLGSISQP